MPDADDITLVHPIVDEILRNYPKMQRKEAVDLAIKIVGVLENVGWVPPIR